MVYNHNTYNFTINEEKKRKKKHTITETRYYKA